MPHYFDCLCVGNAKVDAFLSINQPNSSLRFDKNTNEFCIKSGEKIKVDSLKLTLGGNAANVAVGLSRLGFKPSIFAEIGNDELSQKILNTLKKERVDTSSLMQTNGQPSSFSVALNFSGRRILFSEHVKRNHDFNFDGISTNLVYLTSLGTEWKNAYQKTFDFVKKSGCLLAFNPGTPQMEQGRDSILNVLSISNILFINKEEAGKLIKENKNDIKELLLEVQKLGPKIVVITDGQNGSYLVDEKQKVVTQGIVEAKTIEGTGAGDAYASGFLAGFLSNKSLEDSMLLGAKNASSVLKEIGAQSGLLTKASLF